jgi:hypothetical protein
MDMYKDSVFFILFKNKFGSVVYQRAIRRSRGTLSGV